MDNRRRNGLITLVVLVTAVVALVYYQTRGPVTGPTTAFAPAQSADESMPPADTPIEPPADIAAAVEAEAVDDGSTAVAEAPADSGLEAPAGGTGPDEAASADAPAGPEVVEKPETDVAMVDPATEVMPGDDTELILPSLAVPTFDIVRVEPSGDTVIAGQAEPSALIEIMDGPEVIAMAEANEAGEWVIALEEPLDPGTHDLAISTTSPDESVVTLSDQRVTVSVPEEGSTDVLVVLNAPDLPSTVIQVPSGEIDAAAAAQEPEAGGQADVASAPEQPMAEQAPAEQDVAMAEPTLEAPMPDESEAQTEIATATPSQENVEPSNASEPAAEAGSMEVAVAPAEEPAVTAAPTVEPAQEAAAEDVAPEPAVEPDVEIAAATAPPAADESAEGGQAALTADESSVAEEPAMAETDVAVAADVVEEPAPQPAPPLPPEPLVVVAAVEAESDGALYVAGTATTGETVRVYLDGAYVGDATPSPSGTWLVETTIDLPAGEYLIRADQVAEDGSVIARYEVPFDREVEVAVLKPAATMASAEGATLAGAMPEVETVIIKRGDNLWRIARAAWGKGVRWSTIYEANDDLIRDPHWIYPGQVFVMPKGDATWAN